MLAPALGCIWLKHSRDENCVQTDFKQFLSLEANHGSTQPVNPSILSWVVRSAAFASGFVGLKESRHHSLLDEELAMLGLAANLPFGLAAGMGLSCWLVKSKLFTTFSIIFEWRCTWWLMDIRNSYLRYGIIDRLGLGPEGALAACFVQAMHKDETKMRLVVIFFLRVLYTTFLWWSMEAVLFAFLAASGAVDKVRFLSCDLQFASHESCPIGNRELVRFRVPYLPLWNHPSQWPSECFRQKA